MNTRKLITLTIPTLFFVLLFAFNYSGKTPYQAIIINVVIQSILLLNLKWQKLWISRTFGVLFSLLSFYLVFAWLDDYQDGEAGPGYPFGLLMILLSLTMGILLWIGDSVTKQEVKNTAFDLGSSLRSE